MTLFWPPDRNKLDLTGPRLHAYIVGVGDYPHLKPGATNAAGSNFGLQQLTTTVLTATHIAKWLAANYRNPTVPLGSIELLLSPAQQVTEPTTGTSVAIDAATMANVKATFRSEWLQRCNTHAGNIALFYFAGHGISTASQYLLLSDFADPAGALWDNCIDFDAMRSGMRSSVADTQLFFVDACRETPIDALIQSNPSGASLTNANIFDQVGSSGVYYAAADGLQAYGPPNDITFFATALIESLEGAGALQRNGQWTVDTFALATGLGHIMTALAAETNRPLTVNPNPSGKMATIHCPLTPRVRTSISCRSAQANAEASITLQGAQVFQSPAGGKRPWKQHVEPGQYDLTVTFQNFPQVSRPGERVGPPSYEVEVPV